MEYNRCNATDRLVFKLKSDLYDKTFYSRGQIFNYTSAV